MKKLLLLGIFLTMILSGCSYISVDEKTNTSDENTEQQADPQTSEVLENDESTASTKETSIVNSTNFQDVIDEFWKFDWLSIKKLDAKPVQYLALGDSLTRGVGDETDNYGFTGILARELEGWPAISEVNLDNRGKNGRKSDQLLALLEKGQYDEELEHVDLITITLGGNDVMKVVKSDLLHLKPSMFSKALPPFVDRYNQIIDYIRARTDAPIILVGFYNPFSIIAEDSSPFETVMTEWNGEIKAIAEKTENACFVTVEDLFVSNEDMVYHTDFFHPNAKGYTRMANRVIETMKQCDIETMSDGQLGFEE